MAVLTISRKIGSGGRTIGQKAAEMLGYRFVDKDVINKILTRCGLEPFDKIYESPTSFFDRFDDMRRQTLKNMNLVIQAMAKHGDIVILGRGSYAVLGGLEDVLNVRIQAPFDARVDRYMKEKGIADRAEAEKTLEDLGGVRSSFVESTYNVAWDAASNFDLVIDTDKVSDDMAAGWLVDAVKALEGKVHDPARTRNKFLVEPFMADAVKTVIGD